MKKTSVFVSEKQTPVLVDNAKSKNHRRVVHYDYVDGVVKSDLVLKSEFSLRYNPATTWDAESVGRYLLEMAMVVGADETTVELLAKVTTVDDWHRERIKARFDKIHNKPARKRKTK